MEHLTLVHLSDIHFTARSGGLATRNASLRSDVLNDLRTMRRKLGDAYAVVVTGDVAYSGLPEQYRIAMSWLDEVSSAVGDPPSPVLCVPGNHDVERSAITLGGQFVRKKLHQDGVAIDSLIDSLLEEANQPELAPLANYNVFAANYSCAVGEGGTSYWQTADISLGRCHLVAIRGLTTVLASDGTDRRATLAVGTTQATLPADLPERIYVVLAHHPPDWWNDADAVMARLRNRASLLLFGHKHRSDIERVDNSVRVTAGAVHPEEGPDWDPRYNWITMDVVEKELLTELRIRVYPRVFSLESNQFESHFIGGVEYREHLLALAHCFEEGREADVASTAATEFPQERSPLPSAAERPPLRNEEGGLDRTREAYRAFMQLSYPQQVHILDELELVSEEDRDLDFVRRVIAGLRRATDRNQLTELVSAIQRVTSTT